MAEEDIILARYQADIQDYKAKLVELYTEIKKISATQQTADDKQKASSKELVSASQKRKAALVAEEAELKKLQASLKAAFTAPEIAKFNSEIAKTKNNIALLKGEATGISSVTKTIGSNFAAIGAGIAAAFSVSAIVAFGKESVHQFREAEVNANKLKFAVVSIGEEGEDSFKKLLDQSAKLQKTSIFSDDEIQKSQTQLIQFGLISDEVEKLTPKILDLAAAQGIDLAQATDIVIQGINGQTRALKPLGLEFKNTGDKAENLSIITEKLNKFQGQSADILNTSAGAAANLSNKIGELMERIGESIASSTLFKGLQSSINSLVDSFKSLEDLRVESSDKRIESIKQSIEKGIEPEIKAQQKLLGVEVTTQQKIDQIEQEVEIKRKKREQDVEERQKIINTLSEKELNEGAEKLRLQAVEIKREESLLEIERKKKIVQDESVKTVDGVQVLTDEIKAKVRINVLNEELVRTEKELNNTSLTKEQTTAIQEQIVAIKQLLNIQGKTKLGKTDDQLEKDASAKQKALEHQLIQEKKIKEQIIKIDEENFKTSEENLKLFISEQKNIIAGSATSSDDLEKKITSLQALELQLRLVNYRDYGRDVGQILDQISELNVKQTSDALKKTEAETKETLEEFRKQDSKIYFNQLKLKHEADLESQKQREDLEKTAKDSAINLANQIADAYIESQRHRLQKEQDAETQALSDSKEKQLSSKRLTDAERESLEKEFAAKELALKKKQFEQNKKQAIGEALIRGALAVITTFAQLGYPAGIAAAAAVALATATEVGIISAQKFKKGKRAEQQGGHSLVGEEGPEYMWVPHSAMIVDAQKTKKHKDLINAMMDGDLDLFLHHDYILPALEQHKRTYQEHERKSFGQNVAKALIFHGLTPREAEKIRRKGMKINNPEEIAEAIAPFVQQSNDVRSKI